MANHGKSIAGKTGSFFFLLFFFSFRPGLQAEIMSSLLRLERKQKKIIQSNPFRIRIFLVLSHSFGIETINTFIHSRSSLENQTRFQTKMGKTIPVFRPKRRKYRTRPGGTYLYSLYRGVPPVGYAPRWLSTISYPTLTRGIIVRQIDRQIDRYRGAYDAFNT